MAPELARPSEQRVALPTLLQGAYLLGACRALGEQPIGVETLPLGPLGLDYLGTVAADEGLELARHHIASLVEEGLSPGGHEVVAWSFDPHMPVALLHETLRRTIGSGVVGCELGDTIDRLVWHRLTRGTGVGLRTILARECLTLRAGELAWIVGSARSPLEWVERVSVTAGLVRIHRSVDPDAFAHHLACVTTYRSADMVRADAKADGATNFPPGTEAIVDALLALRPSTSASLSLEFAGGRRQERLVQGLREELEALGEWAYGALERAQYDVLRLRWGLDGADPSTLEQIGQAYGVTRERVRQVETKGVERLRTLSDVEAARLATVLAPLMFASLADGRLHAPESAFRFRRLDPWLRRLAYWLFSAEGGHRGWIARYTIARQDTLVSAFVDIEALRSDEGESDRPLPLPVRERFPASRSVAEHALRAELCGARLYAGFIVPDGRRRRGRRTVRLERLFRDWTPTFHSIERITQRYVRRHEDDPCSARDLDSALREAPHLFLQGALYEWCSVRRLLAAHTGEGDGLPCGARDGRDKLDEPLRDDVDETPEDDESAIAGLVPESTELTAGSLAAQLDAVLAQHGVLDFAGLCRALPDVPPGSVGAIFSTRPDFAWFAPGLIARAVDLKRLAARPPPAFFSNTQVARLAEARHAGERNELYPSWTPANTHALVSWARSHPEEAPDYPSLLAASRPSSWPIEDTERRFWEERQGEVSYGLERAADYSGARIERTPRLALRVLCDLLGRETTNWVRINRLARERGDSKGAIWPLVFLIAAGVLEPTEHWQHPHRVHRARQRMLWERFMYQVAADGRLSWGCEVIRQTVREAREALPERAPGWVPPSAFEQVLSLGERRDAAGEEALDGEEEDSLATLFAAVEAEEVAATLDALGGGG